MSTCAAAYMVGGTILSMRTFTKFCRPLPVGIFRQGFRIQLRSRHCETIRARLRNGSYIVWLGLHDSTGRVWRGVHILIRQILPHRKIVRVFGLVAVCVVVAMVVPVFDVRAKGWCRKNRAILATYPVSPAYSIVPLRARG